LSRPRNADCPSPPVACARLTCEQMEWLRTQGAVSAVIRGLVEAARVADEVDVNGSVSKDPAVRKDHGNGRVDKRAARKRVK